MRDAYLDTTGYPLLGSRNLGNALLAVLVPVPAILCAVALFHWFPSDEIPPATGSGGGWDADGIAATLLARPVLTANLFFFVFVDLAFFAIALVQRSSWLIDPYWTLIPPLLAWFYLAHPLADFTPARAALAGVPLLLWSARLTWNYFRREEWRFGLREDWRYAKMRRERPHFWIEQFAVIHLAQHAMLIGLTLPFWAIAFRPRELGVVDFLSAAGAMLGLWIAGMADNQLDRFMRANVSREQRGERRVELLDTGIWRYSRHPNYFGEQLFWWSIAGFGLACGEPWVVIGTAFNSCVLAGVTFMTERRILLKQSRAAQYADYRRRTSVWIPWPPRSGAGQGP